LEDQEQVDVNELAESNISYQELQQNCEQAMDNEKDILTLFDDNRLMFFSIFQGQELQKSMNI
jgi:hypothetical protein